MLASIIGTLFIAVVVFLAVHWIYRRPKPIESDASEVPVELFIAADLIL